MKSKQKNIRLPENIIPQRYSITLAPNLDEFTFQGEEEILINLTKSTEKVVLHAAELEIQSASIHQDKQKLDSKNITYDSDLETVTLDFGKNLAHGQAKIKIKFTGILNDKMRGFYRSKYELDGKDYHMAVTQFESTDARRAFPSFDEPSKKAVFDVNLIIPEDHTAISNTIETEILEHSPGYKIVKFEPTPKMSTYLLAFIVGKFEHIDTKTKEGVLVRVFFTKGKKKQAEFALDVASEILSFYSGYFKIPYPLPVLDLIAIPDFAAGAMENWGAVTYRETALLVDPELSSTVNKQYVALVIAHELAHMWFGNLVTMEWWTHLWLNEGFASYIEYLAVDHLFPKWHVWTQFVFVDYAKALDLDGLKNTHPIEVEVHNPNQISEIFDTVSYSKGASVIRMLASFLGEKKFKEGLRNYLEKHKYSNASTEDLWKALGKASGKNVGKIMSNWTRKPGYPLVKIVEKQNHLEFIQERFFSSPLSAKNFRDNTIWSIPLKTLVNGKLNSYFLSKKSLSLPKLKDKDWLKVNVGETSFIRVSYFPRLSNSLRTPLLKKVFSEEDRFGIIRDAFMLAQAGYQSTVEALKLTTAYKDDESYIVWAEIASDLKTVENLITDEDFYLKYKAFCREIFKPIAGRVGWNKKKKEPHTRTLLRSIVLYSLGTNGDKKTIKKARELFSLAVNKNSKLDSDLRGVVYNLVAENGGEAEYKDFRELYQKTMFQEEKDRILRALCSFKNKDLLRKTLDFSFSNQVRTQDCFKAIHFVWANPTGRDLAWDFVKENWTKIEEKFRGGHLFSRFIKPAVYFVDRQKAKELEDFFKKHSSSGLERTIAQVLEQIYANSQWLARDSRKIGSFLKINQG